MTKHLLTALLIAGFSVAAKAEPTVYYCNTVSYAEVTEEKVSDVRSYRFKLYVDLSESTIKVVGENQSFSIIGGSDYAILSAWGNKRDFGENAFFGSNIFRFVDFKNEVFSYSGLGSVPVAGEDRPALTSYIADCEKF